MNPNWSKLASLFRALVVLGASSFFGALVLPIATDGTLPTTWTAWRPIFAVAASAAIVSEVIWIRTHLQQAAQAIGVVTSDPETAHPVVKAALLKIGIGMIFVFGLSGCNSSGQLTPQAANVLNVTAVSLETLACSAGIVAKDETANPPASSAQLAIDLATNCGMDLIAITTMFGPTSPVTTAANAQGTVIAARVQEWRARQMPRTIQVN